MSKRTASHQITKEADHSDRDASDTEEGEGQKSTIEEIQKRVILQPRRRRTEGTVNTQPAAGATAPKLNFGSWNVAPATSSGESNGMISAASFGNNNTNTTAAASISFGNTFTPSFGGFNSPSIATTDAKASSDTPNNNTSVVSADAKPAIPSFQFSASTTTIPFGTSQTSPNKSSPFAFKPAENNTNVQASPASTTTVKSPVFGGFGFSQSSSLAAPNFGSVASTFGSVTSTTSQETTNKPMNPFSMMGTPATAPKPATEIESKQKDVATSKSTSESSGLALSNDNPSIPKSPTSSSTKPPSTNLFGSGLTATPSAPAPAADKKPTAFAGFSFGAAAKSADPAETPSESKPSEAPANPFSGGMKPIPFSFTPPASVAPPATNASATPPKFSFNPSAPAATTANKANESTERDLAYKHLLHMRALNIQFAEIIKKILDKDPFALLDSTIKEYEQYSEEIKSKYGTDAKPSTTSTSAAPSTPQPAKPPAMFTTQSSSPSSTPTFTFPGQAQNTAAAPHFASIHGKSALSNEYAKVSPVKPGIAPQLVEADNDEENDTPPEERDVNQFKTGAGEDSEETLYEEKSRLFKLVKKDSGPENVSFGTVFLKLNQEKATKKSRVLSRLVQGGQIELNSYISAVSATSVGKIITLSISHDKNNSIYRCQLGKEESATRFVQLLNELKQKK